MNRTTTARRGLAAAALLGLLAATSACGDQSGAVDPAVRPGLGQHPQGRALQLDTRSAPGSLHGVTHPDQHRRLLAAKP